MKSKNIRKEGLRKERKRADAQRGNCKIINMTCDRIKYRVTYDGYDAIVSLVENNQVVGIYKAAERSWKKGNELVPNAIRISVENFYT